MTDRPLPARHRAPNRCDPADPARRRLLAAATGAAVLGLAPALGTGAAWAQATPPWPTRPVKMLIPFSAGGATDLIVRELAKGLTDIWGQPVVPENRPGAAGVIALEAAARSPADGYTLLLGSESLFSVLPFVHDKLPLNPMTELKPTALVGAVPMILIAHPALKVKTLAEFVNVAKSSAKGLDYASSGLGASHHMSMEYLMRAANLKLNHIAYKGGAPALQDVLAGHILVMWSGISTALPHIQAGKVIPLAVGSLERHPAVPTVPTVAESGYPGFETGSWVGVFAPAATPAPVLQKIERDVNAMVRQSGYRDRMVAAGSEVRYATSEQLVARMKVEYERNRAILSPNSVSR